MKDKECKEIIITVYGAKVSVFSDGSVWVHRGNRSKRRYGNISSKGYMRIIMRDNGKPRTVFVHRLVAIAFIVNPDGKPTINHKNGIRDDNRVENLEWATNKEQSNDPNTYPKLVRACMQRVKLIGACRNYGRKKVTVIFADEIPRRKEFSSLKMAAEECGISPSKLSEILNGKRKQRKRFFAAWSEEFPIAVTKVRFPDETKP